MSDLAIPLLFASTLLACVIVSIFFFLLFCCNGFYLLSSLFAFSNSMKIFIYSFKWLQFSSNLSKKKVHATHLNVYVCGHRSALLGMYILNGRARAYNCHCFPISQ